MKKAVVIIIVLLSTSIFAQNDELIANVKHQFWGQIQYVNSQEDGVDDSFLLKRFRLGAKGDMLKNMKFAFLFEMANSPALLQGWIDYTLAPEANFRAGMFKYPFGIENYVTATTWDFINPSFVTASVTAKLGTEGGKLRDTGIQFSGKVAASDKLSITYYAMVMNGNGINTKDNNKNKDFIGRVKANYGSLLQFGVSYFNGVSNVANSPVRLNENAFGIDIMATTNIAEKPLKLQGEYINANYNTLTGEVKPAGYYAYAVLGIVPETLEVLARYDSYTKDNNTDFKQNRTTFGLSYYLAKRQKINCNYELISDDYNQNAGNLFTVQFQYAIQ